MKQIPANYREAVDYIEELPKFTEKHPLKHTKKYLKKLQNPAENCKVIHVAGTNGKGSVCAYLQAVLQAEGKKTGFFTSPHLIKINERIQIDREEISDDTFYDVFCEAYHVAQEMEQEGEGHPSYFEFLYGMGMLAFEENDAEYIVLETGLGGKLDATNSFEHPFLSVITSIGLDHTEILGDTIEKIAGEKAGIIKKGVPVFFDGSDERSSRVIEETAENVEAPWYKMEKDALKIQEITDKHIAFSILDEYDNNTVWQVASTGIYQVMNAALAIRAMRYTFGDKAEICKWQKVVASVKWQGRMEEVLPGVIFDGAHNLAAIREFTKSIRLQREAEGEIHPLIILFSAVADKDYSHMIELLCKESKADAYVIAKVDNKRGAQADTLAALFRKYTDRPVYREDTLADAFTRALNEKGSEGKLYCLGSLYLVGELKELIGGEDA